MKHAMQIGAQLGEISKVCAPATNCRHDVEWPKPRALQRFEAVVLELKTQAEVTEVGFIYQCRTKRGLSNSTLD